MACSLSGHLALAKPDIRCMFPTVFQSFRTGNCEHKKPWLSAALVPPVPAPLPSTGHNCVQPLQPLLLLLHVGWWVLVPEPLVPLVQLPGVHLFLHFLRLCGCSSSVFPWQTGDLCSPQCASHTPPPAKRSSPNPRKTHKQTNKHYFLVVLANALSSDYTSCEQRSFSYYCPVSNQKMVSRAGPKLAISIWKRRPSWFNPMALMLS